MSVKNEEWKKILCTTYACKKMSQLLFIKVRFALLPAKKKIIWDSLMHNPGGAKAVMLCNRFIYFSKKRKKVFYA